MPANYITAIKLTRNEAVKIPEGTELDAENMNAVEFDAADHKSVFIIENTSEEAQIAVIKAGNGIQGVGDLGLALDAQSSYMLVLDSGKYKFVSGENKGRLLVASGDEGIKLSCVVLP